MATKTSSDKPFLMVGNYGSSLSVTHINSDGAYLKMTLGIATITLKMENSEVKALRDKLSQILLSNTRAKWEAKSNGKGFRE